MQTVGPSRTLTPLDCASAARTSPMRSTSPGFQVEPMAMPQGSDSERRPVRLSPRTPDRRDEPKAGAGGEGSLLTERQALQYIGDVDRVGRVEHVATSAPLLPRPD